MKLFKSAFDKVHFVFVLFAAITVLLGFTLTLRLDYAAWNAVSLIHLIAGILLVASVLFLPLFLKDGKKIYRALIARAVPNRRNFTQKEVLVIAAKCAVLLMAVGFGVLFVTAFAAITGLAPWMPFHTKLVYLIIALTLLHPMLMSASKIHPKKKR